MSPNARKVVTGAFVALFAVTGCSSEVSSGEPVKVAVLGPSSGDNSHVGTEFRQSLQMAKREEGGTVAGHPIEFVHVDSMSNADQAVTNYQQVLQNPDHEIVAGMLNWNSEVSVSVMDLVADEGLAHLAGLGAAPTVNEKFASDPERYGVWSKGRPAPSKRANSYVWAIEHAMEKGTWTPPDMTAVIYGADNDWGHSFGSVMKNQLEQAGFEIVHETYVRADGLDFTDPVEQIHGLDPSLIAGSFGTSSIVTFMQQLRNAFIQDDDHPLVVADGLGAHADWHSTLGEHSNYIVDQVPAFASPEAQEFATEYEQNWGAEPTPSAAGLAHDYFHVLKRLLQAAKDEYGEITRETVRKAHANMLLKGDIALEDGMMVARYVWSSESQPDPKMGSDAFTFPVRQYRDGESVVVWPEGVAPDHAHLKQPDELGTGHGHGDDGH
jgi:ABC-type branched-subunit amino acid transport system substrate-binding protein